MAWFESTRGTRRGWSKAAWTAAPTLALAAWALSASAADETAGKARAKAVEPPARAKKAGVRPAREAIEALRELNAAVQKEAAAGSRESGVAKPEPPRRKTTPPTLTPAALDTLVDEYLADAKAPAATLTTDPEFVRRVYLDVAGKLPTPEQVRAFVLSDEKGKRIKLVNQLLDSPDYATNWGRYWRDVIQYRATNQNAGRIGYGNLESWLADQLGKNRPWDEMAESLITASGRTDENGAVGFTLAHQGEAVEVAGEVSRIFLGVQIQCAQCHDHPNDRWKRKEFHEFASFFAGARARRATKAGEVPMVFEIVMPGKPRYTMPDLKDPQVQIPIAPRFFLASEARPLPAGLTAAERHKVAADLITGQDNPWFAKAFVNRVWYALMGDAFYMPVDDLGPERKAKAPEVIEALASQWQAGGYDVKWLFRTILNSRAYQREVRSTFSASGQTPFASNCPSRLRADQILDSLAQVLKLPLDGSGQMGGPPRPAAKKAMAKDALAREIKETAGATKAMRKNAGPRVGFNVIFGVDPSTPHDDVLGTIPQALFLMNSPQINRAIEARNGTTLGDILGATPDNRVALDALYLRVLAREPNAKEVQACGKYVESVGNRREAFEDILWSLINSTEFITRR